MNTYVVRGDGHFIAEDGQLVRKVIQVTYSAPNFQVAKYMATEELSVEAVKTNMHCIRVDLLSITDNLSGLSHYGQLPRHYVQ